MLSHIFIPKSSQESPWGSLWEDFRPAPIPE
jgi:hypothetical protein